MANCVCPSIELTFKTNIMGEASPSLLLCCAQYEATPSGYVRNHKPHCFKASWLVIIGQRPSASNEEFVQKPFNKASQHHRNGWRPPLTRRNKDLFYPYLPAIASPTGAGTDPPTDLLGYKVTQNDQKTLK